MDLVEHLAEPVSEHLNSSNIDFAAQNSFHLILDKNELLRLQQLSNRTISFGFDCNDNGAIASSSGSPSVSVHDDLKGHHSVINVPSAHLSECIHHYQQCKASAPFSTSACIVAPEHWQRPLEQQLHGMRVLHEYKKGEVLSTCDDASDSGSSALPCSYQVMYDAPKTRLVLNAAARSKLVMEFKSKVGCVPAEFLLDSGAGVSFVSHQFAEKAGLSWDKPSEDFQVSMPDGSVSPVIGQCKVCVRIQAYQCMVMLLVADLADHYDVILGESWMLQHSAYLDYGKKCVVLRKGHKRVTFL